MPSRTKEAALRELQGLIVECDALTQSYRKSAEHSRWLIRTYQLLEDLFGRKSIHFASFSQLSWQPSGSFFANLDDAQAQLDMRCHRAYLEDLETAKGFLQAAQDELSVKSLEDVYHGKNTGPETSSILKVLAIIERKLRKIIRSKPETEREVQDSFENLLEGADLPYSREMDSIEYSSKTYKPDFSIITLDLAIEIKLCNRVGREKEIIAEINDDILAYKQKYGNVIFVVYDVGLIRDIDRFSSHLEQQEGIVVRVVKH